MPSPGLLEAVRRLPNQVRDVDVVAADTEGLPDRRGIRMVVIFGVGAGRFAGDVIEALSEFLSQGIQRTCPRVLGWPTRVNTEWS